MNEQQHEQNTERDPGRERPDQPKIYVASLSDYNAGRLHGAWLDAAVEADELHEGVQTMLAASPERGAEEWAIHDYEGFEPLHLSEYESLERVAEVARGIAESGAALAAWAAHRGIDEEDIAKSFDAAYLGHHDSLEEYAEQLVEDLGYDRELDVLPDHIRMYINFDTETFVRDLECGGYVFTVEDEQRGGVHVFDATV